MLVHWIPQRPEPSVGGPPQTPAPETPDPQTPPAATEQPAPQAPPAPAEQPDAPWSADLRQEFPDEAQRAQVDAYLRRTVQPYLTQLEQNVAPAVQLYTDIAEDPAEALSQAVEELWNGRVGKDEAEKLGDRVYELLDAGANPQAAVEQATAEQQPAAPAAEPQVPREVQEATEFYQQQRDDAEYRGAVDHVVQWAQTAAPALFPQGADPYVALAPFVANADGDMAQAVAAYQQHAAMFGSAAAPTEQTAEAATERAAVEQTAPLDGGTTPAVPQEKPGQSISEAVDEFLAEERAKVAPPTVGAV